MWKYFNASAEGTHLSLKGVDDEVQRMRLDTFDTLLYHVVAVLVLYTLQHMAVQLAHHLALWEGGERERERAECGEGHVIVYEKPDIA